MTESAAMAPATLRRHPDHTVLALVHDGPADAVYLEQRYGISAQESRFVETSSEHWELKIELAPVDRLEYKITAQHGSDDYETMIDPHADEICPTAFGDIGVLHSADYQQPDWLGGFGIDWTREQTSVTRQGLGAEVPIEVLSPPTLAPLDAAPLLLAHDGAEMVRLAGLLQYAAAHQSLLGPFRLGLLSPVNRDDWYAANDIYADALAGDIIPAIEAIAPIHGRPVALGASLGALSFAHAQRRHPELFSAMALQSGSFFTAKTDDHEREYQMWDRVRRAVGEITDSSKLSPSIPVAFSCGVAEENLNNNELMQRVFRRQGYDVSWDVFADAHNFVGWRDAWSASLTPLLSKAFHATKASAHA